MLEDWLAPRIHQFVFPQKTLRQVLPQADDLFADPAAVLAEGPITIGPVTAYRLVLVVGWLVPVSAWKAFGRWDLVAGGVAVVAAFFVWVLLRPGSHRIVIERSGVRFVSGRVAAVCPWSLFNVVGNWYIPDYFGEKLLMPVDPAAAGLVEALQDDRVIAQGVQVKTRMFRFADSNRVELSGIFELNHVELGELLMHLSQRLAGELPRVPLPAGPCPTVDRPAAPAVLDAKGWLTIGLTQLVFPSVCARCGDPTASEMDIAARATGWLAIVTLGRQPPVWVPVPVCLRCQRRFQWMRWGGALVGIGAGIAVGCVWAVVAGLDEIGVFGLGALGAMLGGFGGFNLGERIGLPIKGAWHSSSKHTVTIRFRCVEFARQTVELAARVAGGQ